MKVLKEAASYLVCTYNYSGTLKGRKVIHIKKILKKRNKTKSSEEKIETSLPKPNHALHTVSCFSLTRCYILSYSSICQLASDFTSRVEVCSHLWLSLPSQPLSCSTFGSPSRPRPLSHVRPHGGPSSRWKQIHL